MRHVGKKLIVLLTLIIFMIPSNVMASDGSGKDDSDSGGKSVTIFSEDGSSITVCAITGGYLESVKSAVTLNSNIVKVNVTVIGISPTNKLGITNQLQKKYGSTWVTVDANSKTVMVRSYVSDSTFNITTGTYRVVTTVNAYKDSSLGNTVTVTSETLTN